MNKTDNLQFTCRKCGSHELGYHKYVKCITPVSIQETGQMEYGPSNCDEDDYICADNCFICQNCKAFVSHCGWKMETEKELIDYLNMDPKVREKEEKEHGEHISAVISAQEQERQALLDAEISVTDKSQ